MRDMGRSEHKSLLQRLHTMLPPTDYLVSGCIACFLCEQKAPGVDANALLARYETDVEP